MLQKVTDFSNWLPYLNGQLSDVFNERLEQAVDTMTGMQVFGYEERGNYNSAYQTLASFGGVQYITEGANYPEITTAQGYKQTYQSSRYGGEFRVSKEMWMFLSERYAEIMQLPENLIDDLANKIDQSLADVINNGWSTSYTDTYGQTVTATTPDGLAVFSASHRTVAGGATYSNIITSGATVNPPFSRTAIVAGLIQGMTFTDSAGMLRPINFDTLLVGPALYDNALQTIKSDYLPNDSGSTANSGANNVNSSVRGLEVMKWNRITGNKFYLLDLGKTKKNSLIARFNQKPQMSDPFVLPQNQTIIYGVDVLYHIVRGDTRFIFGSNGTSS